MKYITILLIILSFLSGCSGKSASTEKEGNPEPGVIDYLTGAEHIKTFNKTKSKLDNINKTMQKKYEGLADE